MKVVVRGLHYYAGKSGLRVGMRVILQADPSNPYDANAVAVQRRDGTLIGHVNRDDAALLSPCLLEGMEVEATVHSIKTGKTTAKSCVLNLDIPEEYQEALKRPPSPKPSNPYPSKSIYPSTIRAERPRLPSWQPSIRPPERWDPPPSQPPPPKTVSAPESTCFVATVVFESPDHPTVEWLRWWRDQHLLKHVPGRMFVLGYQAIGPLIARYVSNRPALKVILRQWMDGFVAWKTNRPHDQGKQ
jgi:hypothetical protein